MQGKRRTPREAALEARDNGLQSDAPAENGRRWTIENAMGPSALSGVAACRPHASAGSLLHTSPATCLKSSDRDWRHQLGHAAVWRRHAANDSSQAMTAKQEQGGKTG